MPAPEPHFRSLSCRTTSEFPSHGEGPNAQPSRSFPLMGWAPGHSRAPSFFRGRSYNRRHAAPSDIPGSTITRRLKLTRVRRGRTRAPNAREGSNPAAAGRRNSAGHVRALRVSGPAPDGRRVHCSTEGPARRIRVVQCSWEQPRNKSVILL